LKDLKKSTKQVPSDLKALDQVLSWFDQFSQPQISKKIWLQCQLALAEGFTNAVRHAHKELPKDTPVEIEVTLLPGCLEIRIWDWGPPFDLEGMLQRLGQGVDVQAGGGRGIVILHKIADKLSYTRTDDCRNCLFIMKKY
jgi:serine/threonine-protein kinase RsbW